MKLYIPISSLNFNNILSTESISPKGFYRERNFGYSRWFAIPENDLDGAVLLYEEAHMFSRPQSDVEDHPMLVEIETNEEYPTYCDKIRYSTRTIYLDPWDTRIIFFKEQDRRVALSLSDSSLETKVIRLYQQHIIVANDIEGEYKTLPSKYEIQVEKDQIDFDVRINKYKGLLYGYYIGALLSIDKDDLATINVLREILNIYASVLSSSEKTPSESQKSRLKELFRSFVRKEPLYREIQNVLKSDGMTDMIFDILNKFGLYHSVNCYAMIDGLKYGSDEDNESIKWAKDQLATVERNAIAKRTYLTPADAEILLSDNSLFKISDDVIREEDLRDIYIGWVNDVLSSPKYDGKISSFKDILSDELTVKAKDILNDQWENHEVRTFLNQLRKHVRGGTFSQEWKDGILSSIACCLLKGDEWTQLLLYAQTKGLSDYRVMFSFYGVLNGFANLTRDFTDLLLNPSGAYVSDVYKEFMGQLLDRRVSLINNQTQGTTEVSTECKQPQAPITKASLETQGEQSISAMMLNFLKSPSFKYKGKRDVLEQGLTHVLTESKAPSDAVEILYALNEYGCGWSKNNKPWQILQKEFAPNFKFATQKGNTTKQTSQQQPTLFDKNEADSVSQNTVRKDEQPNALSEHRSLAFVADRSCVNLLLEFIPKELHRLFEEDFKWFQDEYAKGESSKYYAKASRDNGACINAFERYLSNKKYATKLNIGLIVDKLKQMYAR